MVELQPHPSRRHMLRSLLGSSLLLPGLVSELLAAAGNVISDVIA